MRHLLIFVAGPITKGCLYENIGQACQAGMVLFRAGFSVHIPHLTCYLSDAINTDRVVAPDPLPSGTTIEAWYAQGIRHLRGCDALLRLPGESVGADLETAEARSLGIPVFYDVADVIAWGEIEVASRKENS